ARTSTLFPYTTLFRSNQEIAEYFELLSKLMDIHGADSFRAKSYGAAAFRIAKLPMPLSTMDLESLKSIPAIGASTAQKIIEIARSEEHTSELQSRENL